MRFGIDAGKHTFDLAREFGIRGVPISADALADKGLDATLAPLRDAGHVPCQIGAFGYNALTPDADALAKQTRTLEAVIPMAGDTGCRYITISGGNHNRSTFGATDPRNFTPAAIDAVAQRLEPLVALAEKHGACLTIEAYLKTAVSSADAFLALHEKLPSKALRVNIDPTSLYDFADLVDPAPMVGRLCDALGPHTGLIHVKEVGLAEGFHLHAGLVPIGEGPTDWADFLGRIAPHTPDDSWLILEHVLSPEEGRNSIALLRDAAGAAGIDLE